MQQSFVTFAQRSLELMALTYALAYAAANKNHRRNGISRDYIIA